VINVFYLGGKKLKHCVEVLLICVFTVHSLITPHCQTSNMFTTISFKGTSVLFNYGEKVKWIKEKYCTPIIFILELQR